MDPRVRQFVLAGALLAIIILLLLSAVRSWVFDVRAEKLLERSVKENNIVAQNVDKFGRQLTEASSNYVSRDELRTSDDRLIAEVRKELVGPIRTLDRTVRMLAERMDSVAVPVRDTTVIINGEEVDARSFTFSNEWVDIKGLCSVDSVWLNYTMRSDYTLEYHWKTRSLFGPKELVLYVRSKDPNVRVNAVQQFTIVEPTPWYGKPLPVGVAGFASGLLVGLIIDNVK